MLSLFFPTPVMAEEHSSKETKVGIGFIEETNPPGPTPVDPAPYEPSPSNNVLPLTLGQTRYQTQPNQAQATSRGTLPKTGEQRQVVLLQGIGLACIACCFWLFLFTRLREEEENG
nr:cell wall protein [Enterococcus sp. 669A]